MRQYKRIIALFLSLAMVAGMCACAKNGKETTTKGERDIEQTLNLANNDNQEWTYPPHADA